MNIVNPAVSQFSFARQQPVLDVAKQATVNPQVSTGGINYDGGTKSSGKAGGFQSQNPGSIENEMFADQGERSVRDERGLGKLFKKKKADASVTNKAPEAGRAADAGKAVAVDVHKPGGSGANKYDEAISREQAEFKAEDDAASKIGLDDVEEIELKKFVSRFDITLKTPIVETKAAPIIETKVATLGSASSTSLHRSSVGGKEVEPFSSDSVNDDLKKLLDETELKAPDAPVESFATKIKNSLATSSGLVPNLIITGVATSAGTTVSGIIVYKQTVGAGPSPADKLKDTRIVDQIQKDVLKVESTLARLCGKEPFETDLKWATLDDDARMGSLERIVDFMEGKFDTLAKDFGIQVQRAPIAVPAEDIAGRAEAIKLRLAMIGSISHEVVLKSGTKIT